LNPEGPSDTVRGFLILGPSEITVGRRPLVSTDPPLVSPRCCAPATLAVSGTGPQLITLPSRPPRVRTNTPAAFCAPPPDRRRSTTPARRRDRQASDRKRLSRKLTIMQRIACVVARISLAACQDSPGIPKPPIERGERPYRGRAGKARRSSSEQRVRPPSRALLRLSVPHPTPSPWRCAMPCAQERSPPPETAREPEAAQSCTRRPDRASQRIILKREEERV
jgi:hypothetical protein